MADQVEETLGQMIDKLYQTRAERLEVTKRVDAMKEQERQMRAKIIELLDSVGLAKASGQLATCGITVILEPVVNDWDKVHEFIRENDRFDLLQKRLSVTAWREMYLENNLVPGTESMEVTDISLTKSTRG